MKFEWDQVRNWVLYGIPSAVIALLAGLLTISGAISGLLKGVEEPHRWFYLAGLIIIAALSAVSITLALIISKLRQGLSSSIELTKGQFAKMWADTTRSIDSIVNKLYDIDETRWKFTSVREVYTIEKDGTTNVERCYVVQAGEKPAQVWRVEIDADQSADEVAYLDGIGLDVVSEGGNNGETVDFLLYDDRPLHKKIAVFFLPEIGAGQERQVKMTYEWPGLSRDLINFNSTVFCLNYRTCDQADTANLSVEIRVSRELGPTKIELVSVQDSDSELNTQTSKQYTIHKFECAELNMHHRELRLRLSKI